MKISKKDALTWFSFFAQLPEEEPLLVRQQEIAYAVMAQIEAAVEQRRAVLKANIPGLKDLRGRTLYVGEEKRFPKGCLSCLMGTGLSAIRKTNRCNAQCKFCYDYGQLDAIEPIGEGLWEIGGTKYYERDLPLLFSIHKKPTGVSYVYLEPFMEIEKYYGVIRAFHQAGIHQHMYTNGTLATEENLYMARLGYVSPIWSRELTLTLMRQAAEEQWPMVVHDCSNDTKFARDLNLRAKEGGWFGASSYGCEFARLPYAAFLPILRDPDFQFLEEEPLPEGYRPGDIVL